MKKRILPLLLAICMVLTLLPFSVFADGDAQSGACGSALTWTLGASALRATGIRRLQLPKGIQVVESMLCYMCPELESVSIPEGVQNVYSAAFSDCLKLTTVSVPASSKLYGLYGFYNCPKLTDVYYSGTREQWIAFCDRTSSYNEALKSAPNKHFDHVHSYEETVVPASCTSGGYTQHTCECSDTYRSDYTAAGEHSWGEWIVTQPAGCETEGAEYRVCSACGERDEKTVPAPALRSSPSFTGKARYDCKHA